MFLKYNLIWEKRDPNDFNEVANKTKKIVSRNQYLDTVERTGVTNIPGEAVVIKHFLAWWRFDEHAHLGMGQGQQMPSQLLCEASAGSSVTSCIHMPHY